MDRGVKVFCRVSEQWLALIIMLRHSLPSSSVPIIRKDARIIRSFQSLCLLCLTETLRGLPLRLGEISFSGGILWQWRMRRFLWLPTEAVHAVLLASFRPKFNC
jgi:hypothetical protein